MANDLQFYTIFLKRKKNKNKTVVKSLDFLWNTQAIKVYTNLNLTNSGEHESE